MPSKNGTSTTTRPTPTISVEYARAFPNAEQRVWKHRYDVQLYVTQLAGGVPDNPKVAEGWLRAKLQSPEAALLEAITDLQLERGISKDEATEEFIQKTSINGFKRIDGQLVIEGRQAKASLKESFMIALAGGHFGDTKKWGATGKGLRNYVAEHIMVPERYIPVYGHDGTPFVEPTEVGQRFVHTHRGSAIQYEEICDPAVVNFSVWSDHQFTDAQWEAVWGIGQQQGIGATRSQGCGKYIVTKWAKQS